MSYKIKTIEIKDFLSHKNSIIDVSSTIQSKSVPIYVRGEYEDNPYESNGQGKTQIFLQILTNLEQISRGIKAYVRKENNEYLPKAQIKIVYEDSNTHDVIEINKQVSQKGSNKIQVKINDKDYKYQKNAYIIKEVIEPYLIGNGHSLNNFLLQRVFTPQLTNLFNLTPQQFYQQIEDLFDVNFQNIGDKFKERLKEIEKYISQFEQEINILKKDIEKLEKRRLEIKTESKENEIKEYEQKIKALKNKRNDLEERKIQVIKMFKQNIQSNVYSKSLEKYIDEENKNLDVDNLKYAIEKIQQKLNEIQDEQSKQDQNVKFFTKEIKSYEKLKKMKVCPTCRREITEQDLKIYDEKLDELKNQLNSNKTVLDKIQQKYSELQSLLDQVKEQVDNYTNIITQIEKVDSQIEQLIKVKDNLKKQHKDSLSIIDKQIEEKKRDLENKEKEYNQYLKEYEQVKFWQDLVSGRSQIRRQYVVENILSNIESLQDKYIRLFYADGVKFQINIEESSNQLYIGLDKFGDFLPYQILSTGEKKRVQISFIFQLNELLNIVRPFNNDIFIFDEFLDGLDQKQQAEVLDVIDSVIDQFGYQVFITTHNQDLESEVRQLVITVVKNREQNLSRVYQKLISI